MFLMTRAIYLAAIWVGVGALAMGSLRAETAENVAAGIVYARGGFARIKNIQTERMSGTICVGEQQGSFVREVKRPNKLRMEIILDGKTAVTTYDGAAGWKRDGIAGDGQTRALTASEKKSLAADADIDGPFTDLLAKGTKLDLLGTEMLGESLVDKLQVKLKSGEKELYYVEGVGHYILLRESSRSDGGKTMTTSTLYKDFRQVEGVLFPFTVVSSTDEGDHSMTLQFEKIELNGTINDADFGKPGKQ